MSAADAFSWIDEDELFSAYCVTTVTGLDAEEVVRRFGGDLESADQATFEDAFNGHPEPSYLIVDDVDGGVVAAENNGWQGVDEAVAKRVSVGARLAAVYSSVNADMTFVYADDGVLTTAFDPLLPEHEWVGEDPRALDALAEGLPFGEKAPGASALALVERLTGIRIERTWFDEPHRRFDMPSPY